MADEEGSGSGVGESSGAAVGWRGRVVGEWRRIREHAETYPYLWGSYILVYGGLGSYLFYRWRKLRKTEDRVRVLQERLRKLVESEEAPAGSGTAASTAPKPTRSNKSIGPSQGASFAGNGVYRSLCPMNSFPSELCFRFLSALGFNLSGGLAILLPICQFLLFVLLKEQFLMEKNDNLLLLLQ